ncbi:hypothetical protein FALBO_127 [Fusarium albosuccineum]|uniref:Uncharacterized protein n=1 Tax=Fusarium albosuccineum TaxID=1237068 RepID=A0A8H4LR01_9HYPO|nr:hypothetical protein FALBO_127 [Fusarium albosuccineum]
MADHNNMIISDVPVATQQAPNAYAVEFPIIFGTLACFEKCNICPKTRSLTLSNPNKKINLVANRDRYGLGPFAKGLACRHFAVTLAVAYFTLVYHIDVGDPLVAIQVDMPPFFHLIRWATIR